MKRVLTLLFVLIFCGPGVAQDLPPDILADQYLLEATKALESGNPQGALRAFAKIEALDTEPPPEFAYFYGKLLVENSIGLDGLLKGQSLLKQFVLSIEKDSEHYTPTLELLSAVELKLGSAPDEHGDTAWKATRVAVSSSTQGRIEPATDEDWFRLQVSRAGYLRLYPAGSGTWVELYRGEEVRDIVSWSENPNAAVRLHRNGRDNAGNYFTHYRVEPDVYYAVVKIGGTATGPYQFDTRWTRTFQPGADRHDPPPR